MGQSYAGNRQQFFAEEIRLDVHHGVVNVEIETRAGPIDLLIPFNVFFRAEHEARALVETINAESRSRVVPACRACKSLPPGEH